MCSERVLGDLAVGLMPRRGVEWMGDEWSGTQQGGGVPQTHGPPSSDPRAFAVLCPLKVTREVPAWVSQPSVPAGGGMQFLRGSPVCSPRGPQAVLARGPGSAESRRPPFLSVCVSFPFVCFMLSENHMYLFEGKDYSKEPSKEDRRSFEQLVNLQKTLLEKTSGQGRLLRNKGRVRATDPCSRVCSSGSHPARTESVAGSGLLRNCVCSR